MPSSRGPAKFSLAANYDMELIPSLAVYPVDEVYAKLPGDGISGGRPRYMATQISREDFENYIHQLENHGIAFNDLLNGACFGNHEWTRNWQKMFMTLLAQRGEMGTLRITISTPFL